MDAMSKKEKLARGSAVIKVMRVNPRPGHYLKTYIDPRKLPKGPKPGAGTPAAEMPHLDVKNAVFKLDPKSAKVAVPQAPPPVSKKDPCALDLEDEDIDPSKLGLPEGDKLLSWFGYRRWVREINPLSNGNIADHFNVLLGLLISMAEDPENENFADCEAYPCVQFLRTIKTPDGEVPYNIGSFVAYLEYVAIKMIEEG